MIKILATDLDGTLIPLDGEMQNEIDLQKLKSALRQHEIEIIFVTGRHIESVQHAINEKGLPVPEFIIADVGSSIYRRQACQSDHDNSAAPPIWQPLPEYRQSLDAIMSEPQRAAIFETVSQFQEVTPQEDEKQGRHKISFYVDAEKLKSVNDLICSSLEASKLPFSIISSVDPFNGDGLIDVLPPQVTKSFALKWLIDFKSLTHQDVVFAGDSGNDYAAMVGGFNTIVVGNAPKPLKEKVAQHFNQQNSNTKLITPSGRATSGVLQGVEAFLETTL